jgi:hypothetical protein
MNKFLKILSTVLLSVSIPSFAVVPWDPEFSWTFPAFYTSGAPLAITDIAETRIYCDELPIQDPVTGVWTRPTPDFVVAAPTGALTSPFKYFGAGDHVCVAGIVDILGAESNPSNPVNFTVPVDVPVPGVLSVQ